MIHRELMIPKPDISNDDIRMASFMVEHLKFDLFSVPLGHIPAAQKYVQKTTLAAVIDFPYGYSPTSIRIHSILEAHKLGIEVIDVVVNHSMVASSDWKSFATDMKTLAVLCRRGKQYLRAIIDYRLFEPEVILQICTELRKLEITDVITTTGIHTDDIADNLIIAKQIAKLKMRAVVASHAMNRTHYETLVESKTYGVRFLSSWGIESVFQVK